MSSPLQERVPASSEIGRTIAIVLVLVVVLVLEKLMMLPRSKR
jgi:hypothetical protein